MFSRYRRLTETCWEEHPEERSDDTAPFIFSWGFESPAAFEDFRGLCYITGDGILPAAKGAIGILRHFLGSLWAAVGWLWPVLIAFGWIKGLLLAVSSKKKATQDNGRALVPLEGSNSQRTEAPWRRSDPNFKPIITSRGR
jgi:hypothetical protein